MGLLLVWLQDYLSLGASKVCLSEHTLLRMTLVDAHPHVAFQHDPLVLLSSLVRKHPGLLLIICHPGVDGGTGVAA